MNLIIQPTLGISRIPVCLGSFMCPSFWSPYRSRFFSHASAHRWSLCTFALGDTTSLGMHLTSSFIEILLIPLKFKWLSRRSHPISKAFQATKHVSTLHLLQFEMYILRLLSPVSTISKNRCYYYMFLQNHQACHISTSRDPMNILMTLAFFWCFNLKKLEHI